MHQETKNKKPVMAWVYLAMLSIIWGSSCFLMKKGLKVFSAEQVWALRIFFASVFFIPVAFPKFRNLKFDQFKKIFLIGLFNSFIPALLFAKAQTRLDSSINGALNSLTPIFTLLAAKILFDEFLSNKKILGAVLGMLGTVLLIFSGKAGAPGNVNLYVALPILACSFYGICINMIKHHLSSFSSLTINSVAFIPFGVIAGIILFTQTDFTYRLQNTEGSYNALLCMFVLGVSSSAIANLIFTRLIQITSPVFGSMVSLFIPIVSFMLGILDGEILLWGHYLGIAITLFGVYLINKSSSMRRANAVISA